MLRYAESKTSSASNAETCRFASCERERSRQQRGLSQVAGEAEETYDLLGGRANLRTLSVV